MIASMHLQNAHRPNICPALAAAEEIARLEAAHAALERRMNAAPYTSPDLAGLHDRSDAQLLEIEEARERLAAADATSVAGAVAQLLAAIRDIRVRDDAECLRARVLEAKAMRYLGSADAFNAGLGRRLSQTRYPAPCLLEAS